MDTLDKPSDEGFNRFDYFYMNVAKDASQLSRAIRRKVGALVVKDGNILAFSYNGTLPGQDNTCEDIIDGVLVTRDTVLHAEENALLKMSKSNGSSEGATLYATTQPCLRCSRMIAAAGIKRVVYNEAYRDSSGVELLVDYGVKVQKMENLDEQAK
jgi:dCMP deaminase